MNGRVCLVTGAASGIGKEMCIALAKRGATVVVSARDAAKAEAAAKEVAAAAGPGAKVESLACDVASVASMKKAAAELLQRHPKLHLLVNNAAVFNKERRLSADGLELNYAVNVLAPFVMCNLLGEALKAAAPSRIVNMTMPTKTPIDFSDLQSEKKFVPLKVFEATKGGHQYLTRLLAERLSGTGISVITVTPGLTKSKLPSEAPLPLRLVFKLFGKQPEAGARVPVACCVDAQWQEKSGTFLSDKGVPTPMPAFIDAAAAQKLWDVNAKLARL